MAWLLPRIPGTGSCGQKLSFWLHREYAEAECGAEGFASLPAWQRTKGDISLCVHDLLKQQCIIWRHRSPWLGTYKWRGAKNMPFLMILLGNIRDLFLKSGKHLHCKHYVFVGINNSSDQYLLVVNYSIKRLVVLLKIKYDWPQNKSTTNLRIDYKVSLNIMLFQIWVPHISIPIFHFVSSIQMCQGDWGDVNTAEIIF